MSISRSTLQMLHQYLSLACRRPFPDEDVIELRRRRRQIADRMSRAIDLQTQYRHDALSEALKFRLSI